MPKGDRLRDLHMGETRQDCGAMVQRNSCKGPPQGCEKFDQLIDFAA